MPSIETKLGCSQSQSIVLNQMKSRNHQKIRVVAGKPGLDGHDRGIKVVTRALRDAGMEVIYLGMRLSVDQIADAAVDEDADVVAINFSAADHLLLAPLLFEALKKRDRADDLMVVVGGIIPDEDIPLLKDMGVNQVFLPGTPIDQIVMHIQNQFKNAEGKDA